MCAGRATPGYPGQYGQQAKNIPGLAHPTSFLCKFMWEPKKFAHLKFQPRAQIVCTVCNVYIVYCAIILSAFNTPVFSSQLWGSSLSSSSFSGPGLEVQLLSQTWFEDCPTRPLILLLSLKEGSHSVYSENQIHRTSKNMPLDHVEYFLKYCRKEVPESNDFYWYPFSHQTDLFHHLILPTTSFCLVTELFRAISLWPIQLILSPKRQNCICFLLSERFAWKTHYPEKYTQWYSS